MLADEDRKLVREIFHAEAGELLDALEQGLLALEATPDAPELLERIFGSAHSLKGGAAMVGLGAISELAHHLEDLLERLRRRTLSMSRELGTLLLQGHDALRVLHQVSAEREPVLGAAERALIDQLSAAALGTGAPVPAGSAVAEQGSAEPGAAEPGAPGHLEEPGARREGARTLRVGLDRLDRMLNLAGEIAVSRGRLAAMLESGERYSREELLEAHRDADRLYLDLQEQVMKVRMVPVERAFQPFSRTLRDLCASTGKRARLELSGEDVEVDTTVVELLRDPLTHMVRNAFDHGLETPEARTAAGKDPTGTLALHARHDGGSIVIEVSDDGRGLDRERIRARARETGLHAAPEQLEDAELFELIFAPGFSTAAALTELSGRGMGMSVVRRNVEQLRGSIRVDSEPGKGTLVTLRLPLTVSIIEGFSVGVGEETYVLPLDTVLECLELPTEALGAENAGVINLRGRPLPFLRLRSHFRVPGALPPRENVVVVGHGRGEVGLAVDVLLGQAQTVIKPLGKIFAQIPGVTGSAILGTGQVALILDVPSLLQQALRAQPAAA
ncbi:chemotaxis protein CheA [Aggregicoccus sp. 17bor-14]|uniref:chemotaxis protein CheA n=1 Tax=Myxococcaceae TaxID=31 RepID=UPI00129C8FE8|nr:MULTISPECIES: chemotaxis protein CheA [Myxococcaceae]MBF5044346.1 chemotaxis protein CheA [Simulacricoccus sp. 17bor-14]MRI90093.1 chemotaxis protein CheA [Aggregicoccus sp. 17bor-14]